MAEVTNFITMLGKGIQIVGVISVVFSLLELADGKSTNDARSQRMAQYGLVFGAIFVFFGPKAAAAINAMIAGLG